MNKDFTDPIKELLECHRDILSHTERLRDALRVFRSGGSPQDMRLTLDVFLLFMRTSLKAHKYEEENALFPLMRQAECPEDELRKLVEEHEEISSTDEFIRLMDGIETISKDGTEDRLTSAIEKLEEHVRQEEEVLYRIARERLGKEQLKEVSERIKSIRGSS